MAGTYMSPGTFGDFSIGIPGGGSITGSDLAAALHNFSGTAICRELTGRALTQVQSALRDQLNSMLDVVLAPFAGGLDVAAAKADGKKIFACAKALEANSSCQQSAARIAKSMGALFGGSGLSLSSVVELVTQTAARSAITQVLDALRTVVLSNLAVIFDHLQDQVCGHHASGSSSAAADDDASKPRAPASTAKGPTSPSSGASLKRVVLPRPARPWGVYAACGVLTLAVGLWAVRPRYLVQSLGR